jgi:RNA recognition motif-containing protein
MSKSDDIERLRAILQQKKRSRSRDREKIPKKAAVSTALTLVDESLNEERSRQQAEKSKKKYDDSRTKRTQERMEPRNDDCTVMIQGLKAETDERQIYQFFAASGKVRDVQILKDNNSFSDRRSKGVAFVEFYEIASVYKARKLNGQQLDGRVARVSPVAQPEVAEYLRRYGISLDENVAVALRNAVPEVQQAAMEQSLDGLSHPHAILMQRIQRLSAPLTKNAHNAAKPAALRRDTVVVLKNLFKPAEVDLTAEPEFYTEIEEDIKDGCSEHGDVLTVIVDRDSPIGRAVVQFASAEAATACQKAMNGRMFGGQQVEASTMPEGQFNAFEAHKARGR